MSTIPYRGTKDEFLRRSQNHFLQAGTASARYLGYRGGSI